MKPDYAQYYDYLVKNNLSVCYTTKFGKITIQDCVSNLKPSASLDQILNDPILN